MSLQGPEKKQELPSTKEASSLPQTREGTMGNRQVVLYDPRMAPQSLFEMTERVFQDAMSELFRRSLEADRYAALHLHQYGEGKIFVLLGNSTAGKTSIVRQLMSEAHEFTESGMDMDFPLQDAAIIQAKAPRLYERMARAMEPKYISYSVMWNDEPHWKPGVSEAEVKDAQEALEEARKMGFDVVSQDAQSVRTKTPALYERMARAMEHRDIANALFGDEEHWKPGVTEAELKDAQEALKEARKHKDRYFPLPSGTRSEEHERRMEETVIERSAQGRSVIFDPYDEKAFLARMIEKNHYAPLKMGLAYCPFNVLAERVRQRNIEAFASGNIDNYRNPLSPLQQFCDFYKPAERGDTVIDTLQRDKVEQAFESAFKQQAEFLLQKASKHPLQPPLTLASDKDYVELMQKHDQMKTEMLEKLGFLNPSVREVKITTSRKGIDYLFNTHVMKPSETSGIIREWK